MSTYTATTRWDRGDDDFLDRRYHRRHAIRFDGGVEIVASSSPQVVPVPMSDPSAVDPEEAFVASISSCHLLWFLSIAASRGFRVDRYEDRATGTMARDARGRLAIVRVVLAPDARFSGPRAPTRAEIQDMHERAHDECFIANSVRSEVVCEPVWPPRST
ncbi:MAG: OsmC family protein [Burkholderiales bacterium]